jgi:hypothetical protein
VMDEFVLQGAEEALGHRVVIAVVFPTHTRRHAELDEPSNSRAAMFCPAERWQSGRRQRFGKPTWLPRRNPLKKAERTYKSGRFCCIVS